MTKNTISYKNKCFAYSPSTVYPTVDDWTESFPHVYMEFDPFALIPLYPRDYMYLEDGKMCMGLDYLTQRIILGGIFMRNQDILFNKNNNTVQIVRADCTPKPSFNFTKYYGKHSDGIEDDFRKKITEEKAKAQEERPMSPTDTLTMIVLGIGLCIFVIFCRLYVNRFRDRQKELVYSQSRTQDDRDNNEIDQTTVQANADSSQVEVVEKQQTDIVDQPQGEVRIDTSEGI